MICNGHTTDHSIERARRVVLIVDIVESVRLVEADEEGIVARWLTLVRQIENDLMPANKGHLVKSLGDGLLLEFEDARTAIKAAFAIQQASARENQGQPPDKLMLLRIGIEESDVIINERDVFGHGVNLAARFTSLAGPGEIVTSAAVREQLTPDLDADVEDLGDCFLKHVKDPVRTYRVRPPGSTAPPRLAPSLVNVFPTLSVIPFTGRGVGKEHEVLGEILAEELIRDFSRSPDLNVISRLSTTAFRQRIVSLDEVRDHLNANYIVSGTYRVDGGRISVNAELAETKTSQVVWSERIEDRLGSVVQGESGLVSGVVSEVRSAIVLREVKRARALALPTLETYSLLLGAITMMHRLSKQDFERARQMLEAIIERAPREAIPRAWLAQWYVLRVQQGWAVDPQRDNRTALSIAGRALDTDPESSLALAIDGLVHTHLLKRFDVARERYDHAIKVNPSDPLAWLLSGTLHAFTDEGNSAVEQTETALSLSPFDPHRYYYDSLTASAYLTAGQFDKALELARHSLRANRSHTSTLRVMAVAQWKLGQRKAARETGEILMTLEPNLTITGYLERTPSADYRIGREIARVLRKVGVPD